MSLSPRTSAPSRGRRSATRADVPRCAIKLKTTWHSIPGIRRGCSSTEQLSRRYEHGESSLPGGRELHASRPNRRADCIWRQETRPDTWFNRRFVTWGGRGPRSCEGTPAADDLFPDLVDPYIDGYCKHHNRASTAADAAPAACRLPPMEISAA
jgi:hypothetical protein